jgi:small-conductance mechanosensitive channel
MSEIKSSNTDVDKIENMVKEATNVDDSVFNRVLITVVYIFVAILVFKLLQDNMNFIIQKLNNKENKQDPHYEKKVKTIERLSLSILKTIIVIVTALFILSMWGISVSPLLAGAGIIGLAVGLGAQTFLKDVINGLNIMVSGKMNIGDHVIIKNYAGLVTDISINATTLKAYDGRDIIIPNGFIDVIEVHVK